MSLIRRWGDERQFYDENRNGPHLEVRHGSLSGLVQTDL